MKKPKDNDCRKDYVDLLPCDAVEKWYSQGVHRSVIYWRLRFGYGLCPSYCENLLSTKEIK